MTTTDTVHLVWFRDDLRLEDQPALATAAAAGPMVALVVVDPSRAAAGPLGVPRQGEFHSRFRLESITDLRSQLAGRGGTLVVRIGDPVAIVPAVTAETGATVVHANAEPCTEERAQERRIRRAIAALPRPARLELHAGSSLVDPEALPLPGGSMPRVFTKFRRLVERRMTIAPPVAAPIRITRGPAIEAGEIPSLADLGLDSPVDDPRGVLRFRGGAAAGLERLEDWVFEGDHLGQYKETRNGMLGASYSSKFSPWLAHGCLGPRTVHAAVQRYEQERGRNDSTIWLVVELLWRDFFRFVARHAGGSFFRPGGLRGLQIPWSTDAGRFDAWREGRTGVPMVDASMRELDATGFMSNRGRQIVASFLTKNLGVDWRLGAAWFESRLLDHDPASNWGNWASVAGVGNDAREFRWFNPLSQAERYDGDGEHARTWIPEIAGLRGGRIHEPWRCDADEWRRAGIAAGEIPYPAPIVDIFASADESRLRQEAALARAAIEEGDAGPA